jgi:hypothetical protein
VRPRRALNPKRRLAGSASGQPERLAALADLARRTRYGGNPEHKRHPGDFDLDPPSDPRLGKTLCDDAGIVRKEVALGYLQEGLRRGLVSIQSRGEWPQNVWAVSAEGVALESQLENQMRGVYHGYPMPDDDPLRTEILGRWRAWTEAPE